MKVTSLLQSFLFLCSLFVWVDTGTSAQAEDIQVGLAYFAKSAMSERVIKGMQQKLQSSAPNIKVEYHEALSGPDELKKYVDQFQKEKAAMIIMRSPGAQWLLKNPPTIPTFISACNNPEELGVIKNMRKPEGKITGTTYFLPRDEQFDVFQMIVPEMKSLLLVTEKGHPSGQIDQAETREACKKRKIEFRHADCANLDEVKAAIRGHVGTGAVIVLGSQALLLDNPKQIVDEFPQRIILGYSDTHVRGGALGGFVADDVKLGQELANSLIDVLINKKPIAEVPVKVDRNPKFYINIGTAERLGIDLPYDILIMPFVVEWRPGMP